MDQTVANNITDVSAKNVTSNVTVIEAARTPPTVDQTQAKLLEFSWVNSWREVLAFVFAATIAYDFIVAPLFVQVADTFWKAGLPPWAPLTTQGGGLYFVSMGAILGISSYGKFSEQRELIRNMPDYSNVPTTPTGTAPAA